MTTVRVRLGADGLLAIPVAFRLGPRPGDRLMVRLKEGRLLIESRRAAVRAAGRMIRERVPRGELLIERLFELRRAENASG